MDIEVGDVFAHIATGGIEYVATRIDDRGRVWAGDGYWSDLSNCRLVRKADPYHGIPLDQPSPIKSWQFRESPWVVPEPKTLADVPELVDCVVFQGNPEDRWVRCRVGDEVRLNKTHHIRCGKPEKYKFVRYLDSPPQKPLRLDDVPDGRVILYQNQYVWRVWPERNGWLAIFQDGTIRGITPELDKSFTITNYIAEFK